jgi:hypothetical protein
MKQRRSSLKGRRIEEGRFLMLNQEQFYADLEIQA